MLDKVFSALTDQVNSLLLSDSAYEAENRNAVIDVLEVEVLLLELALGISVVRCSGV